jgi:hypothetical protein
MKRCPYPVFRSSAFYALKLETLRRPQPPYFTSFESTIATERAFLLLRIERLPSGFRCSTSKAIETLCYGLHLCVLDGWGGNSSIQLQLLFMI